MNSGYKLLSIIMHIIFYSNNGTKLELVSPVISAAVLCGEVVCDTSPETSDPVRFELVHKPQVRMLTKVWLDYIVPRDWLFWEVHVHKIMITIATNYSDSCRLCWTWNSSACFWISPCKSTTGHVILIVMWSCESCGHVILIVM